VEGRLPHPQGRRGGAPQGAPSARPGHLRPSGKKTLREWLEDDWLPAVQRQKRATTAEMYGHFARSYVIPTLGSVPLQELTPSHLDRLYTRLLDHGGRDGGPLAPNTVRRVHTLVHKALDDAVRKGDVTRNVASYADQPPVPRSEMQVWWPEQTRAFLEHVTTDRLAAAWLLFCTTGMRRSEVCGLKWTALDLDAGRLEVVRTLVMVGRKPVLVEDTKSASSRRAIDLDPATAAALKAHRARQLHERLAFGAAWTDTGLVFTREDGVLLRPEWVSKRFQQLAADAGLPRIRLHDLRHSYASAALEAGAKVEVLSKRLGHSKISITQDIYLHVRETADREVADTVAQAILGPPR
jgi:integrase